MKSKLSFVVNIVLLTVASATAVRSQQVFKATGSSVIAYLEYLPAEYHSNSDKYPVVIFLHGVGERGTNTTDLTILSQSVLQVTRNGPPLHVKEGHQFPFILISPQLKDNYGDWPSDYVLEVIDYIKTYLRIDEKRIYLTGLSLGGGGAWWTAQDYPELFAALAPVCGGRNTLTKACDIASENLPVWAFHGDKDTIVPLSRSVSMVNAINACQPAPVPAARMTIYAGIAHDSWTNAYRVDHALHDPNVYDWMLSFTNTINRGNKLPTAIAGADQTLSGTSTSVTGSGTDSDGSVLTYRWAQLSGPDKAVLTNVTTRELYASALKSGTYVFSLQVTDNAGGTDTDYVSITTGTANVPPVAQAGADRIIYLPSNTTKLYGTATDVDGSISAYSWTLASGPPATLTGANTSSLTLSDLASGTYIARLTVTDDKGAKGYDDVNIQVKQSVAPIANAGSDKLILLPTNAIALYGSGSDSDGTIAYYKWTQRSGAATVMNGSTSPTVNISGLMSGVFVFRLTVTDNSGMAHYDDVLVRVTEPPVVNAGIDLSISLPVSSAILTGTAYDPDGTIKSYAWSKYSGPTALLENKAAPQLSVSALKEGTYVFMLKVVDNSNAKATDYVTLTVQKQLLFTSALTNSKVLPSSQLDGEDFFPETKPDAILNELTTLDLENCLVTIFNDAGDRIFYGNWSAESYQEIFTRNGLYVYHIIKNGKRIDAGKIYLRR
jgi:predicted esterase